MGGVTQI